MRTGRARNRIRFELMNEGGNRIVMIFEGRISREKLMHVRDFMKLYCEFSEQDRQEYRYEGSSPNSLG